MALTLTDADFARLSQYIQKNFGINLTKKRQLIVSRLSNSIMAKGYSDFAPFVDHLLRTEDDSEISLLLDKLTTNYTFFMREKNHFDFFHNTILPDLVKRHEKDKVLSIWSAGCSTGEEPYNISMYLMDYLGTQSHLWDTRILATDISSRVLVQAKEGIYELPDTLPANWKKKYFVSRPDGRFSVSSQIRNNVIFRPFNLMSQINFKLKFDVIFCRNVMIYFDATTKNALVQRFYNATAPGGYLLIGFSENLSPNSPYHRLAPSTFQK